jgi:hypothetical protein
MRPFVLDRRTFLRGAGGVGIGLPLLEAMLPRRASAQGAIPKRYVLCFAGMSLGRDNTGKLTDIVPDGVGTTFNLRKPMAPLEPLKDQLLVVSGLKIPVGGATGRLGGFHKSSISPLLSGTKPPDTGPDCHGATSDQIVANDPAFKGKTRFPYLTFRAQADAYRGGGNTGVISWRGSGQKNDPTVSPRLAFGNLFAGFGAPAGEDSADAAARMRLLRQEQSVLDLVRGNSERLASRLGSADRSRLERHFQEIRDLEKRLKDIPAVGAPSGSACAAPGRPSEADEPAPIVAEASGSGEVGYAGEDARARALTDILAKALVCDLARVATLQYTFVQCFMNVEKIVSVPVKMDVHELAHLSSIQGGKDLAQSLVMEVYAWHMKHFAALASQLKAERTPDGKTMLDHTVLVFVNEGGLGPYEGKNPASHSTDNMMVVMAGGGAGGLKLGRHLAGGNDHPARVLTSAMNAAGAQAPGLGDVSGRFEPAFG